MFSNEFKKCSYFVVRNLKSIIIIIIIIIIILLLSSSSSSSSSSNFSIFSFDWEIFPYPGM